MANNGLHCLGNLSDLIGRGIGHVNLPAQWLGSGIGRSPDVMRKPEVAEAPPEEPDGHLPSAPRGSTLRHPAPQVIPTDSAVTHELANRRLSSRRSGRLLALLQRGGRHSQEAGADHSGGKSQALQPDVPGTPALQKVPRLAVAWRRSTVRRLSTALTCPANACSPIPMAR
jgi:hypothetical protein